MGDISLIILIFLVTIIIFWIFENIGNINREPYNTTVDEHIDNHNQDIVESPIIPKLKTIPKSNIKRIIEEDLQTQYYVNRQISEQEGDGVRVKKICPRETQTNDEFNKDFFAFRDKVYHSSSMMNDGVDKMNDMILNGGQDQKNMKIKDIYDQMTSGVNLYSDKTTRLPYFDNTMHDNYNYDFISGMHNTQDNWIYQNENEMNGGSLEKNFYGNDPNALMQMPAL